MVRQALLALSASSRRLFAMMPSQSLKTPEVCIVGAGMAGLRCAELLLKGGLHVTIFEARDRVGGRVSFLRVRRHDADKFECQQSSFLGPAVDLSVPS